MIRISRLGWFAIAAIVLLPWIVVAWALRSGPPPAASTAKNPSAAPTSPARPPAPARSQAGRPGPWGQLEYSRILIEPPEDFIPAESISPQPLRWTFTGYTAAALEALWQQAGLSPEQSRQLRDPARLESNATGLVLLPPAELVLDLTSEARATIYAALAAFPENVMQRNPFRARTQEVDDWLADPALPRETTALTHRLLYRRGPNSLFSDHDLVLPGLPDTASRIRFIKTLSRKSALLVQLNVPSGADVDALSRYWAHGRRSRDIKPLIDSLAQRPQGGTIDIAHLLPHFARVLLYSYPLPSERAADALRDCHWTSLNFAQDVADDRFTEIKNVQEALRTDYYPVSGEPMLGDIVVFLQAGGVCIHSCVYIADDIVFTKNGASFSIPWTLAHLDNVVAFYSLSGPLEIRRYRPRPR